MWVMTRPPPGARPLPAHNEIVAFDFDLDAVAPQYRGGPGKPVRFLDPQLFEPAHDGRAFREGGSDGQHRIFVDHRRRARGGDLDAAQRAAAHPQISDLFAAFIARAEPLDRGAHLGKCRDQPSPQRIQHHALEDYVRARQ